MQVDWLSDLVAEEPQVHGLRRYQEDAVDAIWKTWEEHDSVLVVMATGLGKTQVGSSVAGTFEGRALILCHRSELIDQWVQRLQVMTGEAIGIEQAEWYSGRERIVVGSVQTVHRDRRLKRLKDNGGFDLVIVDEAHHYVARTYRKAVEAWTGAKVLGVTATPDRGDERALGQIFDKVAYEMDILAGIDGGWLVPIVGRREEVEMDISGVDTVAGDLVAAQLEEEVLKATEGMVTIALEKYGDRTGIAFFPGVKSAEYACERFNLHKPGSAAVITGETDPMERKEIVRQLHAGEVQYLCNCMVATEGFDWPAADVIFNGRPTKSRALYAQIAGRGTRALPGTVDGLGGAQERREAIARSPKAQCILVDFVGNSGKHDLCCPEDLLGGVYGDEEVKEAKKRAAAEGGGDPMEHLRAAQAALKALAAKAQATVRRNQTEEFDPFSVFGSSFDDGTDRRYGGVPATAKQVAALSNMGVPNAHDLSRRAASEMFKLAAVRRQHGLATFKQMKLLQKYGVTKTNVTFEKASEAISYIAGTKWGKSTEIDPHRLREITE